MNAKSPFSAASTPPVFNVGFSDAVRDLALQSLDVATLPEHWEPTDHKYGRHNGISELLRSEHGAWGIIQPRFHFQAATELFVSRLAVHAGVPVAPVFYKGEEQDTGLYEMCSVIPFQGIFHGFENQHNTRRSFRQTAEYLKHYASTLPFFLWLGNDMDRAIRNVCMDAKNPAAFGEFDFDNTDLTNVFKVTNMDPLDMPENLRQMHGMSYYHAVEKPAIAGDFLSHITQHWPKSEKPVIIRYAFQEGMKRLSAITDNDIDQILDIVETVLPVPQRQREALHGYLGARQIGLIMGAECGEFDDFIADHSPYPSVHNNNRCSLDRYTFE